MEIKDFWEEAHQKNEELWLTGSYLNQVWDPLNITPKLVPGLKVLNIGVGLGQETMELSQKGVIVDVLDISQSALNRVKDITRNQYLSSNLIYLPINEYDIVVSHLVTQHMNDDDLNLQMKYVVQSLKPNGIFAMQFAFIDDDESTKEQYFHLYKNDLGRDPQQRGHMFRTLNQMADIAAKNLGYISWTSEVKTYSHTPIKWYYVHIKRVTIK